MRAPYHNRLVYSCSCFCTLSTESLALQAVAAAASAESSGLPGAVELGASSSSDLSKDPSSVPSVSAVPLWWSRLPYPWETADETRSILSDGLMQDVLTLLPFAEVSDAPPTPFPRCCIGNCMNHRSSRSVYLSIVYPFYPQTEKLHRGTLATRL
jgi:hypothetical protein